MKKQYIPLFAILFVVLAASIFAFPTARLATFSHTDMAANATEGIFIGNSRTKIFHNLECKWAELYITKKPYEVVYFYTHPEALEAGFRACRGCKP